jgi:hypothetical protein
MTTRERAHIHVHIHCTFLCNTTSTGILYVTTNSMCYPRHHRCVYTCETLHSTYHKLISSNSPLLVVFSIIYAHTYIHIYIIETAKHGSRSTACAYPICTTSIQTGNQSPHRHCLQSVLEYTHTVQVAGAKGSVTSLFNNQQQVTQKRTNV